MLEANEGLENIFENAVKEAEKRRHEYVTIEHVLVSLIKDKNIGTVLHDFKINVGALIKDVEDYLDTKCNDIVSKSANPVVPRKTASLERLMNRAFTQALFQGRQDVTSIDIMISIFEEKKSWGAMPKSTFPFSHTDPQKTHFSKKFQKVQKTHFLRFRKKSGFRKKFLSRTKRIVFLSTF